MHNTYLGIMKRFVKASVEELFLPNVALITHERKCQYFHH